MTKKKAKRRGRPARAVAGPELSFGSRLKGLRSDAGLSIKQVAAESTVSRTTLQNYESGRSLPGISELRRLSLMFDVSVDYLIHGAEWAGGGLDPDSLYFDTAGNESMYVALVGASMLVLPAGDREAIEHTIESLVRSHIGSDRMKTVALGAMTWLASADHSAASLGLEDLLEGWDDHWKGRADTSG